MNLAGITYHVIVNSHTQVSVDQDLVVPELEPLYEPEPIEFSFDTPAWYILLAIIVITLIFGMRKWYKNYRKKEYRRIALRKLKRIQMEDNKVSLIHVLRTIQITLKQVAIATYGRQRVAALFGTEWLQFLETTGKHTPFTQHTLLVEVNTEKAAELDASRITAIHDSAKKWIKSHA